MSSFRPAVGNPHPIEEIALLPSGGGRFEIVVDGQIIYSKAATGRHPSNDQIIAEVGKRLAM